MNEESGAAASYATRGYERGIVTFIDILGFKTLLKTRSASEIVEILGILRASARGDGDGQPRPRRMDEARLYSQSFSESVSDAVVRVRTVDTQALDGPFQLELVDLLHAQVECLQRGILIRGAMTIGPVHAGLDGRGPIFGEAMVKAYEIEQTEAVHPRIVIDENALSTFTTDHSLWQHRQIDANDVEMLERYVALGDDGMPFLDYLRAADESELGGLAARIAFIERHRDVIMENARDADGKTRRKLVWLANYHNRFVHAFSAEIDQDDTKGAFLSTVGTAPGDILPALLIDGAIFDLAARRLDRLD